MHVWVVAFIVESGVPAEVVLRNLHGVRNLVAVRAEQIPPRFGIIIAKTNGILTLE
jgi:hypothetical protein